MHPATFEVITDGALLAVAEARDLLASDERRAVLLLAAQQPDGPMAVGADHLTCFPGGLNLCRQLCVAVEVGAGAWRPCRHE